MNAFIKFNKGMLSMPLHWQLWVMLLVVANLIVPMFFFQHIESQVVLGTVLASMVLMVWATGRFGFTRIVGAGHFVWIPMLAYLFTQLGDIPLHDGFGVWIRALFVLNGISLVIDAVDAIRYVAGERQETVVGL